MTEGSPGSIIRLEAVSKKFGSVIALQEVNLDVFEGEIVTLLGPSGCGKTTLMRLIAGFEAPSSGRIYINDDEMTGTPPEHRPVNLVFQRYALFPHLDVFDNIAFGLRLKKLGKDEIRNRVNRMLKIVDLPDFGDRWTNQLSGGQAQRVALGRALVNEPSVLLLDEPLAALDLKIRQQMLVELKRIHEETGTTFVYVTHDQDEAMILSDRIVLMNQGAIVQVDVPESMYARPRNLFCAQFLGETNLLAATVTDVNGQTARFDLGSVCVVAPSCGCQVGDAVTLSVRPETVVISDCSNSPPDDNCLDGRVTDVAFIGNRIVYTITDGHARVLRSQEPRTVTGTRFHLGSQVRLSWPLEANVVLRD